MFAEAFTERDPIEKPKVLIIGAGVIGLTTGIVLAESTNIKPIIWAKDLPPNTTSDAAGAFLYPAMHGANDRVPSWFNSTARRLRREAEKGDSGVIPMKTRVVSRTPQSPPDFGGAMGNPDHLKRRRLPPSFKSGYELQGAVMDTSIYMKHLVDEFRRLGGLIEEHEVTDIEEAFAESDIVVNCTGLGSRKLFGDQGVFPLRGQVLKVSRDQGLKVTDKGEDFVMLDDVEHAVVIPRTNDYVLGTTVKDDYRRGVRQSETEDILKKTEDLVYSLGNTHNAEAMVGLRPGRLDIRLEHEQYGNQRKILIHNYGHGGAGFSLSWGCAQDVRNIVNDVIRERRS